jgi:hypothetical protein
LTNGLRPKSPAEVVDDLYSLLCRGAHPSRSEDLEKRINLVGIDLAPRERTEIDAGLQAMGLTINSVLNHDASLEQFLAVRDAKWNAHPGPHMMMNFDEQSRDKFGQEAIEVPLPFGVGATDRFYAKIAAAVGADPAAWHAATAELRGAARAAIDRYRERLHERIRKQKNRPPRCAFNVGSVRSFDLRRLAHEEMGELPFFDELGIERTIFIQGPQDAANRERTAGVLVELGITDPFVMFPDPGSLAKYIKPGEFDVFVGADFLADQLSKLNLPLLNKSHLGIGYAAVGPNLDLLDSVMFQSFYRHFEPAQDITGPVE